MNKLKELFLRFREWQKNPMSYMPLSKKKHRCKNCGQTFVGHYCPRCGQ